MITEDYVSFEAAKLLKENGFDESVGFVYSENGELLKLSDFGVRYLLNSECDDYPYWQFPFEGVTSIVSAPTLQMAMKWLREKHNIHIMIDCIGSKNYLPTVQYTNSSKDVIIEGNESKIGGRGVDSYEEACEAAIKYYLENLENLI